MSGSAIALYVIGFAVLLVGLYMAAQLVGLSQAWTLVGIIVIAGIAILALSSQLRDGGPGPE